MLGHPWGDNKKMAVDIDAQNARRVPSGGGCWGNPQEDYKKMTSSMVTQMGGEVSMVAMDAGVAPEKIHEGGEVYRRESIFGFYLSSPVKK
jgi:hypothetical protein